MPDVAPKWLATHIKPQEQEFVCAEVVPPHLFCFREAYAGHAQLTRSVMREGLPAARPLEAFPSADNTAENKAGCFSGKRYISVNDFDCEDTVWALEIDIKRGLVRWVHFGIPCTGWSSMNTFNGGTRSVERPDGGDEPLEREVRANRQATIVCRLCLLLHDHRSLFTIENPVPSHLWESVHVVALRRRLQDMYFVVTFD